MIGIGIGVDKGKKRTGVDAVQAYLNRVIADGGENLLSKAEIEALSTSRLAECLVFEYTKFKKGWHTLQHYWE
jgi:hypothetical protein